ncbi:MAG: Veg family protein [Lachnospiraceae bacterium]|nr:Veg family protein [Lachnospiraceae bacterium]
MERKDVEKIRASVKDNCGSLVEIQLDRGRNKVDIEKGIIKEAYPSVFTIQLENTDDESAEQILSFSYTDIITKDIRMRLCEAD